MQAKLAEAEASAMKGGKGFIQKLEQKVIVYKYKHIKISNLFFKFKIYDLESELEGEQKRHQETIKEVRKQEKRVRELNAQVEDERKTQTRLQDLTDKLQEKLKTYKKQIEETEEIASLNLAKYRRAQHELDEAAQRADQAENQIAKVRAKNRGSASTSRANSPQVNFFLK